MTGVLAMMLYIGCYTTDEKPEGLRCVDIDPATGRMTLRASYRVDNPLYFAKSADGAFLYSTGRDHIDSFAIASDGALTPVDSFRPGAAGLCHIAFLPDGECLAWAAYGSGEAGLVAVKEGRFRGAVRHDRHPGRGPDPRQASAHCHAAVPTPDGRHYAVVDLGIDALVTYGATRRDAASAADGALAADAVLFRTLPAGAGPRHLLFHPDGKHAFVVFELGSRLALYAWSETDGFRMLDSRSTLPPEWHGLNQDAAIRFTPDGRRVVVSNRGYDSLTVFDYDLATGRLAFVARSPLPGSWPRDFMFIPDSDLAIVTMERSGTLVSVRYDAATGVFTPVDSLHALHRPVAVIRAR